MRKPKAKRVTSFLSSAQTEALARHEHRRTQLEDSFVDSSCMIISQLMDKYLRTAHGLWEIDMVCAGLGYKYAVQTHSAYSDVIDEAARRAKPYATSIANYAHWGYLTCKNALERRAVDLRYVSLLKEALRAYVDPEDAYVDPVDSPLPEQALRRLLADVEKDVGVRVKYRVLNEMLEDGAGRLQLTPFYRWFYKQLLEPTLWSPLSSGRVVSWLVRSVERRHVSTQIKQFVASETRANARLEFRRAHVAMHVCVVCQTALDSAADLTEHKCAVPTSGRGGASIDDVFTALRDVYASKEARDVLLRRTIFSDELGKGWRVAATREDPLQPAISSDVRLAFRGREVRLCVPGLVGVGLPDKKTKRSLALRIRRKVSPASVLLVGYGQ